jgi:hypothetical protein
VIGVWAPARAAKLCIIGIGRTGMDVLNSRSCPKDPPAARAMASAWDFASTTAAAKATERTESAVDDENCKLEISFAPFPSAASITRPTSSIRRNFTSSELETEYVTVLGAVDGMYGTSGVTL